MVYTSQLYGIYLENVVMCTVEIIFSFFQNGYTIFVMSVIDKYFKGVMAWKND